MRNLVAITILLFGAAGSVSAGTISWTDWTSTSSGVVNGTMGAIGVTYTGAYAGAQVSGGTNYWNPSTPYISATVPNAPPASDIIQISTAGLRTFTFSQPVYNPVLAIVSLNGANKYEFSAPIDVLSYGAGYWGGGTLYEFNATTVASTGEGHGAIRILGTFSSLTLNSTVGESWNGFTIGYDPAAAPPSGVPEPGTLAVGALLPLGFFLLRRRR